MPCRPPSPAIPGMPMGMADVATVLFGKFLKFDAARARLARSRPLRAVGRPRLDAALRAAPSDRLSRTWTSSSCKRFRQLGSRTAGHPEHGHAPGIETTTGPLGQGLGNAVGMALAERHLRARFGAELVDHRTYVIASDGDLMEGISHEACSFAGHQRLDRLIVLFDDNHITIDGAAGARRVRRPAQALRGLRLAGERGSTATTRRRSRRRSPTAQDADRPSLIACRTTIGYGAPTKAGTAATHGSPLGADEIAGARARSSAGPIRRSRSRPRSSPPGAASAAAAPRARDAWSERLGAQQARRQGRVRAGPGGRAAGRPRPGAGASTSRAWSRSSRPGRRRKSSQEALEAFTPAVPELVGGSADLTGSNNTKTKATRADDPARRRAAATSISASASTPWPRP